MHTTLMLLGLGVLTGIRAQATNASIALPGFDDQPFSGEVVGTGTDGTTYVISASGTGAGDIPFTITVVQDATHVSEVVSLATGLGGDIQCAYDTQGVGTCTIVLEGAGSATGTDAAPQTSVISGTIPMLAVPVTTASVTPSATQPADSPSGSSSSAETPSSSSGAARTVVTVGLTSIFPMILASFITV